MPSKINYTKVEPTYKGNLSISKTVPPARQIRPLARHGHGMKICFALLLISLAPYFLSIAHAQKKTTHKTFPSSQQAHALSPLHMDVETYVLGNTLVTLYHELGHGLVDLGGLPILGREEDAVDAFALVELITQLASASPDTPAKQDLISYGYATIDQWLKSGTEAGNPLANDYFGTHALSYQRYFQSACLLYGGSKDQFGAIADTFNISQIFLERCKREYFTAYDGWSYNLHTFGMLETGESTGDDIIFEILPASREQHARWANLIKNSDLLEQVQRHFSSSFKLPRQIQVTFESCEEENAFYFPATNSISMCYELMAAYARYYRQNTDAILRQGL